MKEYVNKTKQNMINHPRGTLDCSEVIFAEILFFRYLHEIYSSTIQNHGVASCSTICTTGTPIYFI